MSCGLGVVVILDSVPLCADMTFSFALSSPYLYEWGVRKVSNGFGCRHPALQSSKAGFFFLVFCFLYSR